MTDGHDDMAEVAVPQVTFTRRTALALIEGGGQKYRRVTRTIAIQVDQPFAVDTGHGVATGKAGDFLAVDASGFPYPVDAETFAKSYSAVTRKPKVKDAPVKS